MQTQSISNRFFRAGVGTVIYNQEGRVAWFKRAHHPVGVWQFQQGGIDLGEHPIDTLWRELAEEIGLTKDDIAQIDEYPYWTTYQYDETIDDASKPRLGQTHRWFFLKLKSGTTIDLSKATDIEASDYACITFDEVVQQTDSFKKHVYQELHTYFEQHIVPTLHS